jgi:hypothetical protein
MEQNTEKSGNEIFYDWLQERKKLNIYARMGCITFELVTVAKNLEVSMGKAGKYKAVGEADVLRAVKPLEAKYGIYSYPFDREIIESGTLESTDFNGNVKKQLFERIKVVYRFINVDNPTEFVDTISYGDGIDSGDKSVGKAMTYADKYALLKAYKIVTGEDPDQDASEELKGANVQKKLDAALLQEAEALNIDLNKVAVYLKKKVDDLTNADLKSCIEQKKKAVGGAK